jgi:prepilin-type N-terminal cleavage/methylation domain-containing protein
VRQATKGLTLIEILIALVLLGFIVTAITQPIVSSFQIARTNRLSLDATSEAQRIIETIRGQWQSPSLYDSNCAVVTLGANKTVTLRQLNSDGTVQAGTITFISSGCGAATTTGPNPCPNTQAPMKRVTVAVNDVSAPTRNLSTINFDIVCPRRL